MDLPVPMHVIGVVRTAHTEVATTPIQVGLNRAEHGTIEIADRYQEGLAGLADFDYAWLLTWLHKLAEPGTRRSGGFPSCCKASSERWACSPPAGDGG